MMNMQQEKKWIELGGTHTSSSSISRRDNAYRSPSKGTPPLPSRQMIDSSHRIPMKKSPTRQHMPFCPDKPAYRTENDQSFTDLELSKISNGSRHAESRPMLADKSNRISPKQMIKITYPSRKSSVHSRDGDSRVRQVVSPKLQAQTQCSSKEAELLRKLTILESRVGELHRQKHKAVARLNEENRKIYHENTSLKLKVSQLTKSRERRETVRDSVTTDRASIACQASVTENESLKSQIRELQKYIEKQMAKSSLLAGENKFLQSRIVELTSLSQNQNTLLDELKDKNAAQLSEIQKRDQKIMEIEGQIFEREFSRANAREERESEKQRYQENEQKLLQKIKEYEVAYNENQALIKELQYQVRTYECQQVSKEYEESKEDIVQNDDFKTECYELENNFIAVFQQKEQELQNIRAALQEKEDEVVCLKNCLREKDELIKESAQVCEKNQKLEQEIREYAICGQEKNRRLEEASILLEKMTTKFETMSERYSQLNQKYENQKGKMNKSEGFQQSSAKCRKCDDLLKTILRLNSQLNPKKVAS